MSEAKKPALSSKVMGLKFMQRAQEKQKRAEDTVTAEKKEAEAHWVVESAKSRCVVIASADPVGGGGIGRLSFNKFNPETEKLQQEAEDRERRRLDPEGQGAEISDEAMAAELAQRQKQQQGASGAQRQGKQQPQQQRQREEEKILPLRQPKRQRR